MNIQLFSDLHMEFYRRENGLDGQVAVHPQADVVVLAGDIDTGENAFRQAYTLAQTHGKQVLFVPGNHEFYHQDWPSLSRKFAASARDGVHVLMDSMVEIDGVRFCGGTLWTDFALYKHAKRMNDVSEAMQVGAQGLNDFRIIRDGTTPFTAYRSAQAHEATRAFIDATLDTPFEGKTVVVTHHAPHPNSIHPRFAPGERVLQSTHTLPSENPYWRLNVCFASDLTPVVEKADIWLHGHVHDSMDYQVGKCRVYANPRGYPVSGRDGKVYFENEKYDPGLLIEV